MSPISAQWSRTPYNNDWGRNFAHCHPLTLYWESRPWGDGENTWWADSKYCQVFWSLLCSILVWWYWEILLMLGSPNLCVPWISLVHWLWMRWWQNRKIQRNRFCLCNMVTGSTICRYDPQAITLQNCQRRNISTKQLSSKAKDCIHNTLQVK